MLKQAGGTWSAVPDWFPGRDPSTTPLHAPDEWPKAAPGARATLQDSETRTIIW